MLLVLRILVPLFYSVALTAYYLDFKGKLKTRAGWSTRILILTLLLHTTLLGLLMNAYGQLPLANLYAAMSSFAWIFTMIYLVLELLIKDRSFGLFALPVVVLLQAVSSIFLNESPVRVEILERVLFEVHVILVLISYAAFAVGAIGSVMYIILSKKLREQNLDMVYTKLPSMPFLMQIISLTGYLGHILLTVGILLGVYNAYEVWGSKLPILDPKYLSAFLTWIVYAVFVVARLTGWGGDRRSAFISLLGFVSILFAFLVVSALLTTEHLFN